MSSLLADQGEIGQAVAVVVIFGIAAAYAYWVRQMQRATALWEREQRAASGPTTED